MKYTDKVIKFKGKDLLKGNEHPITVSIPQFEDIDEVRQGVGGDDGIVALANAFYTARAPSSFRSSVMNFMKDKAANEWDKVVTFINERFGSVKDYSFTADRGPSRKTQHELLDALKDENIEELSLEEMKARMRALLGK